MTGEDYFMYGFVAGMLFMGLMFSIKEFIEK